MVSKRSLLPWVNKRARRTPAPLSRISPSQGGSTIAVVSLWSFLVLINQRAQRAPAKLSRISPPQGGSTILVVSLRSFLGFQPILRTKSQVRFVEGVFTERYQPSIVTTFSKTIKHRRQEFWRITQSKPNLRQGCFVAWSNSRESRIVGDGIRATNIIAEGLFRDSQW